jgi:hypothetical protein
MRVLEQEKKISEFEELNRIPESQEMYREEEQHKLQTLVKVSKHYSRCISELLSSIEIRPSLKSA